MQSTCILDWKISWTVEPGGLSFMGLISQSDTTQHTHMQAKSNNESGSWIVQKGVDGGEKRERERGQDNGRQSMLWLQGILILFSR